jgi:hypothetical protein
MATVRSLDPRTAAGTPQPVPRGRLIPALAGLVSLVFAVVSAAWLVVPSTNPFADPDSSLAPQRTLLGAALPPRATAALLLGGCVAGVVVAAVALTTGRGRSRRLTDALMGGFGLVFTLVVGVGLLSEQAIVMAGYMMALLVPAGAVVLGVQVVRTSRVGRWVVGGVVAAASAVFAAGVLPVDAWVTLGRNIAGLAEELASIGVVLGLTVAVLLWALVGGTAMRDGGTLDAPGRWVLRHRRTITVLAALGPVPYAVLRLTWLTPWPYGVPSDALPPDTRIWGLLLSSGAWAGMILTIGLIRPWGEVFPRWMPLVAGRPVPVWLAAAPGSVVAAILCVSAVPMIRMFAEESAGEALTSALILPFWFWGPMLALAVWGYVLHRGSATGPIVGQDSSGRYARGMTAIPGRDLPHHTARVLQRGEASRA